jgi:mRNA degradation ribonuclease J1/J2
VAGARPARPVYLDAAEGAEVSEDDIRIRRMLGSQGAVFVTVLLQPSAIRVEVASAGLAAFPAKVAAEVGEEVRTFLERGRPADLANPQWVESEAQLAAKRSCRRALGARPVVVVAIARP